MAPGIDLNDQNVWDDSVLINSWNEALKEYEKYHSIQAQGKCLEDVLSQDELQQLTEEHGDLIDEVETRSTHAEQDETGAAQAEEPTTSVHQEPMVETQVPQYHGSPFAASMPQALFSSVQDENVKNLMMSWYYAGYYTGLQAGQQQAATSGTSSEQG